jgi:N-methyl-L-proline demethylase
VTSTWDVLTGTVPVARDVLLYDDNGAHPGMTAAEFVARAGAAVEIVTPERALAPDVGGTSYPAYFKVFSDHGVTITLNLRLEAVERDGNRLRALFYDEYGRKHVDKTADQVVVEHGAVPLDELYFALRPHSLNFGEVDQAALLANRPQDVRTNPDGAFTLWRIGDAVASRNIHAAVYDALRLLKDV